MAADCIIDREEAARLVGVSAGHLKNVLGGIEAATRGAFVVHGGGGQHRTLYNRDAFLVFWKTRRVGRPRSIDTMPSHARTHFEALLKRGFSGAEIARRLKSSGVSRATIYRAIDAAQ